MDNKTVRRIGILFIVSTILFDFIFFIESGFTFNLISAFILGAINVMAINFIRVIFSFNIEKVDVYGFGPCYEPSKKAIAFLIYNIAIVINLKE